MIIIAVGRLAPQKRLDRLISAYSRIAPKFPEWKLDIYGEGELHDKLLQQINELEMSGVIHLRGKVPDIQNRLRQSQFFVLPSEFEGFPLVLLEAKVAGIATVAYASCRGAAVMISDNKDGLLVPTEGDEIDELATVLEKMMNDWSLRKELGKNARLSIGEYDIDLIAQRWSSFLSDVCKIRQHCPWQSSAMHP